MTDPRLPLPPADVGRVRPRTRPAQVFHIDQRRLALPDPGLAGLLREVARGLPPGHAGKLAGAMAAAVSGRDGAQPGAVHVAGLAAAARAVVAEVLAGAAARAQEAQHPAAGALAGLAAQWGEFAGR